MGSDHPYEWLTYRIEQILQHKSTVICSNCSLLQIGLEFKQINPIRKSEKKVPNKTMRIPHSLPTQDNPVLWGELKGKHEGSTRSVIALVTSLTPTKSVEYEGWIGALRVWMGF